MEELKLVEILLSIMVTVGLGFVTFFWWTYRKLIQKVDNSYSKDEVDKLLVKTVLPIRDEMASIKNDTRSMAESVLASIKALEERMDKLMLHLMRGKD